MTTHTEFPFTYHDSDGDELVLKPAFSLDFKAYLRTGTITGDGVYIHRDDAPAIALAILEASGVDTTEPNTDTPYFVRVAVRKLRQHFEHEARLKEAEARQAAEAAAREEAARKADEEKLDAEAWELYKAHWGIAATSQPGFIVSSPGQAQERDRWRKVALAARNAHARNH